MFIMEKCIHPECTCAGYKQPTGTKGTLLLLRAGCHDCSHLAAEHRKLTAMDTFICDEVQAALSRGCGYQIPVLDVPRSPVFSSHDPIHLPLGDSAQDCSVVCTCEGFVTSSVVSLQQALYRRPQSEVKEELGKKLCMFCHHPLSSHEGRGSAVPIGQSEVAMLSRLRVKGVAELRNLTSPSVLTLDHSKRQFVFVCLHSSTELVALTTSWDFKEAPGPQGVSEQDTDKMEIDVMEPSKPVPVETSDATETSTKAAKKRRTKRRSSSSEYVRRSARLEAKKLASLSIEEPSQETKPVVVPVEATERFVRELREPGSYKKLGGLPGVLSGSSSLAVLSTSNGLVVAPASLSDSWVGVVPIEGEMVWSTLTHDKHGNYTCLSLAESPTDNVFIAMGMDRGEVMVWKVGVHQMCVSTEMLGCVQDLKSQVTAVKWAPDARILAVGCFHGDVLLYSCEDELISVQTMSVCGASVTSLAWSMDGRSLAVGGSDDCVQVLVSPLSCTHSPTTSHNSHPTLFNYFKKINNPKFQHTLTLKGHQSFIADVHFTLSGLLLTLGWDGQVLIWTPSHHPHPHTEDSDPVGGFKIGPSTSVKFLPLNVTAVDNGLLVTLGSKHSELTVVHYSL